MNQDLKNVMDAIQLDAMNVTQELRKHDKTDLADILLLRIGYLIGTIYGMDELKKKEPSK